MGEARLAKLKAFGELVSGLYAAVDAIRGVAKQPNGGGWT